MIKAAAILAVFLWLRRSPQLKTVLIAAGVSVPLAVIAGFVWPEHYGGFGNENFITEFILIGIPLVCLLVIERPKMVIAAGITLAGAAIYLIGFNNGNGEYLVLFVCLLLGLAGLHPKTQGAAAKEWHRYVLPIGAIAGVLGVLVSVPALTRATEGALLSLTHRVEIWFRS